MLKIRPICSTCEKDIKGRDVVYVKMKYPTTRGMTEIKAYLQTNGEFICEACYKKEGEG